MAGRKDTQNQCFWILGEGEKSFWQDKWLGDKSIKDLIGWEEEEDIECWELWTNGLWDRTKIDTLIDDERLKDRICEVNISQGKDELCWMLSKDGKFDSKSAWKSIRESNQRNIIFKPLKNNMIRTNVRCVGTKLFNNCLPTDQKLKTKGISVISRCHCLRDIEYNNHLFWDCQIAQQIWKHFGNLFAIRYEGVATYKGSFLRWVNSSINTGKNHIRSTTPMIILWEIWTARNEARFKSGRFHHGKIIGKIIHHIWTITLAWSWKRNQWKGDLSVSKF